MFLLKRVFRENLWACRRFTERRNGLAAILRMPNALVPEGVVAVALPSAVIATMLGARYKTYEAEAGSTLFLTTVLMMAVVPLSMFVTS
jgi:predicted permease